MNILNYIKRRKEGKLRKRFLDNTIVQERVWLFNYHEFVDFCATTNDYVFCLARAVDFRLIPDGFTITEERRLFNARTVNNFISMVSHESNRVRPSVVPGMDSKSLVPHPIERTSINSRVYKAVQAMKDILSPYCSDEEAEQIAKRYIHNPYEVER